MDFAEKRTKADSSRPETTGTSASFAYCPVTCHEGIGLPSIGPGLPLILAGVMASAGPAAAQTMTGLVAPGNQPARSPFRMPDPTRPPGEAQGGIAAFVPVNDRLQIGVGRFDVLPLARPRTHVENDRNPVAVRGRQRGMAAAGFTLRF